MAAVACVPFRCYGGPSTPLDRTVSSRNSLGRSRGRQEKFGDSQCRYGPFSTIVFAISESRGSDSVIYLRSPAFAQLVELEVLERVLVEGWQIERYEKKRRSATVALRASPHVATRCPRGASPVSRLSQTCRSASRCRRRDRHRRIYHYCYSVIL